MTRTYALHKLLLLGPLCYGDMRKITGWTASQLQKTVYCLEKSGRLQVDGERGKYLYSIYQD